MTVDRSPRLQPLPVDQWGDDARAAVRTFLGDSADRLLAGGPDAFPVPNVLGTLMHHPALAGPWLAYNNVLLKTPSIDARLRELIILRVAWRTGSEYEWVQHVRIGRRLGIVDEEIDAIAGVGSHEWTDLERDLLTATDELLDGYRIGDATWARLAGQLDERQLLEVVFVVGTYTCLAMAFESLGIQLDPDLVDDPALRIPRREA